MEVAQKQYGSIIVDSNPSGATVFLDGVEKGFTPQELTGIEVGTRRLMLVMPGYETLNKGVIVNANIPINVSEVLIPKTAQPAFPNPKETYPGVGSNNKPHTHCNAIF